MWVMECITPFEKQTAIFMYEITPGGEGHSQICGNKLVLKWSELKSSPVISKATCLLLYKCSPSTQNRAIDSFSALCRGANCPRRPGSTAALLQFHLLIALIFSLQQWRLILRISLNVNAKSRKKLSQNLDINKPKQQQQHVSSKNLKMLFFDGSFPEHARQPVFLFLNFGSCERKQDNMLEHKPLAL